MDRLQISGNVPADIAERQSDVGRDQYTADHQTTDDLWEVISTSDALKEFLDDEPLAGPLSAMVIQLPKCIGEIAGRVDLPEYQSLLRLVAQMERVLVQFVQGEE